MNSVDVPSLFCVAGTKYLRWSGKVFWRFKNPNTVVLAWWGPSSYGRTSRRRKGSRRDKGTKWPHLYSPVSEGGINTFVRVEHPRSNFVHITTLRTTLGAFGGQLEATALALGVLLRGMLRTSWADISPHPNKHREWSLSAFICLLISHCESELWPTAS